MLVMFDLPTNSAQEKKAANNFRKFLVKEGFHMVQLSVYARVCNGLDNVEKYRKRLRSNVPESGSVRLLTITEQQYTNIDILVGTCKKHERNQKWQQISFF